jgi:hypothetical protein
MPGVFAAVFLGGLTLPGSARKLERELAGIVIGLLPWLALTLCWLRPN